MIKNRFRAPRLDDWQLARRPDNGFAFLSLWALRAGGTGAGQQLPILAGTRTGKIATRDKARAVARDYIEATVLFLSAISATHLRPEGITAAASEQLPVSAAAGSLRGVLPRLVERSLVANDLPS